MIRRFLTPNRARVVDQQIGNVYRAHRGRPPTAIVAGLRRRRHAMDSDR